MSKAMKVVGTKWAVEYDFVNGEAMDIIFFNDKAFAEAFAKEFDGVLDEYTIYEEV